MPETKVTKRVFRDTLFCLIFSYGSHYSRTCWKAGGGISVEWLSYLERVNVGLEFHRHLLQASHGEMLT